MALFPTPTWTSLEGKTGTTNTHEYSTRRESITAYLPVEIEYSDT